MTILQNLAFLSLKYFDTFGLKPVNLVDKPDIYGCYLGIPVSESANLEDWL